MEKDGDVQWEVVGEDSCIEYICWSGDVDMVGGGGERDCDVVSSSSERD